MVSGVKCEDICSILLHGPLTFKLKHRVARFFVVKVTMNRNSFCLTGEIQIFDS